jgi:hypothetical protein
MLESDNGLPPDIPNNAVRKELDRIGATCQEFPGINAVLDRLTYIIGFSSPIGMTSKSVLR